VSPNSEEPLPLRAHLERLRAELNRHGLDAELAGHGARSFLRVANREMPTLNERVFCRPAKDESLCFWWPWRQPIGGVDELDAVVEKITAVLRSVEGQP
jgi:hypothetical protein